MCTLYCNEQGIPAVTARLVLPVASAQTSMSARLIPVKTGRRAKTLKTATNATVPITSVEPTVQLILTNVWIQTFATTAHVRTHMVASIAPVPSLVKANAAPITLEYVTSHCRSCA